MSGRSVRVTGTLVAAVWILASAGGCARLHARNEPDVPALEVPDPPSRAVEPVEVEATPPAKAPEEPRAATPARTRPAAPPPAPARPEPRAEAPKTEPPPPVAVEAPKPPEEAKPAPPPPTNLQTTPTAAEVEVERSIRVSLARAMNDLNRVDYRVLNPDARTQYDTAKRFIQQSDDALRAKNLVFAKNLADKAAALAAQLAGK